MNIRIITTNGITQEFVSWPERVQARALVQNGHSVQAYTYLGKQRWNNLARETIDGVVVQRLRHYQWVSLDLLKAFLTSPRPDIVHFFHLSNQFNFQALLLCKLLRIPTVLGPLGIFHDPYLVDDRDRPFYKSANYNQIIQTPNALWQNLIKQLKFKKPLKNYLMHSPLQLADSLIALSEHEKLELVKLGVKAESITVIPCSVDKGWLDGVETPTKPADEPQIFYLGQFKYRKGFDLLAQAMPLVVQKFPKAQFIFAGHSPIHQQALLTIAEAGGVADHLTLLNNITEAEKAALFLGSDVYVCPSRYEGFGIPLIEAMSAGCPIVTTNVPAMNEIVQDGENGLLFELEDYKGLAEAIIKLLSDQTLREKLIAGGLHSVERYYTSQIARELEETYKATIAHYKSK